jgi:hypothetical protein
MPWWFLSKSSLDLHSEPLCIPLDEHENSGLSSLSQHCGRSWEWEPLWRDEWILGWWGAMYSGVQLGGSLRLGQKLDLCPSSKQRQQRVFLLQDTTICSVERQLKQHPIIWCRNFYLLSTCCSSRCGCWSVCFLLWNVELSLSFLQQCYGQTGDQPSSTSAETSNWRNRYMLCSPSAVLNCWCRRVPHSLANLPMSVWCFLPCGIEVSLSFLPLCGGWARDQPSSSSTAANNW